MDDEVVTEPLECATCGEPLDGDPDEHATGDAGMPICGECERTNHFVVLDAMDGELDDQLSGPDDGCPLTEPFWGQRG
ncbi:MAG TPA: hypothetical protein VMX11_08210 [Actinomycetes bacterium]|nr:hypothetical protein [Actinomycetes bacterium]